MDLISDFFMNKIFDRNHRVQKGLRDYKVVTGLQEKKEIRGLLVLKVCKV